MSPFVKRSAEWCRGREDHRSKKLTLSACEKACKAAGCVCFQYKSEAVEANCRLVLQDDFIATVRSKAGFDAYVRPGAVGASVAGVNVAAAHGQAGAGSCGPGSGAAMQREATSTAVPPFYVYDAVPAFSHRALVGCYMSRNKGKAPWANDSPGASHVATAIWIVQALRAHPARVHSPGDASVLVVPTFGSLSDAVGLCQGGTHFDRMHAAASALKALPEFSRRPRDHLLINAASTPRNLLGELGELAAQRGARAACLHERLCVRFKPEQAVPLPWTPLPQLMAGPLRGDLDRAACTAQRSARSITLFYRGALGSSRECQAVRVRIPLLRVISGADIRLVGDEQLFQTSASFAAAHQVSLRRGKRDVNACAGSPAPC